MYEYRIDSSKTLEEAKEFERQYFGAKVSVNDSAFAWRLADYMQQVKKKLADQVAYDLGEELGPQHATAEANQLCCAHGMGCYQYETKAKPAEPSQLDLQFTKERLVFESKKDSCT